MPDEDVLARYIMNEAKRKHFNKKRCLYCNTIIEGSEYWCKPSCAVKYIDIVKIQK